MSLRDFWNKRIDVAFVLSRDPMLEALDIISTVRPHLFVSFPFSQSLSATIDRLSRRPLITQSIKIERARSTPTS
jgi:hypothetical protein